MRQQAAKQLRRQGVLPWLVTVATHNRAAAAGVIGLVLIAAVAATAPVLAPYRPDAIVGRPLLSPRVSYVLGTDALGRDVLSRTLWGARSALVGGASAIGLAAAVGVPIGAMTGFSGRVVATVVQRVVDIGLAFPGLILALLVIAIEGPGGETAIVAAGVAFVPVFARLAFSLVTRVSGEEYLLAGRAVGCSRLRILVSYVGPAIVGDLAVLVSSGIGWAVLLIATLNFLGVGAQPPMPDWGADLAAGTSYLAVAWWISTAPGVCLTVLILSANYAGEFLGDLFRAGARRGARAGATIVPSGPAVR